MIRRQVVMPVSPERLWAALTDPEELAGWFGAHVQWDLEEGGAARFLTDGGSERAGRVEAIRPGRHLRFRWWPAPGEEGSDELGTGSGMSEVSYVLEAVPEGTRLTVQERQVDTPASDRDAAQAVAGAGWTGGCTGAWTAWDGRLAGAWAGLLAPALEGVRA